MRLIFTIGLLCMGSACASKPWYDSPPPVPVPMTPADLVTIENGSEITFAWTPVTTAEYYDFHIFDRTSSDIDRFFRSDLRPGNVCSEQQCMISIALDMPVSTGHAWRVRAGNNAGASSWSRTQFEIVDDGR